jgi:hypothetical protein
LKVGIASAYQLGLNSVGLIPAIILAAFNLILPIIFEILTIQEGWSTPLFVIQLSVLRFVCVELK